MSRARRTSIAAAALAVSLTALGGASAAGAAARHDGAGQRVGKAGHHGHQARRGHYRRQGYRYRTTTVRWGPFTVPAANGRPGQLDNAIVREGGCHSGLKCIDVPMKKPCVNCSITRIVPNLVDAKTGETVNFENGGMLHHVVNVNWSHSDTTCPVGGGSGLINLLGGLEGGNERFFASGNERTITRLPRGYGLPVRPDDEWGLILHLMNMTPQPRDVAVEYRFTWTKRHLKPVKPVWLDVDNCGDSEVDVPTGYSDVEWDWNSTLAGRFVAIGGHVHDNGISIAAENATTGRVICTSRARYAHGSEFAPAGPGAGTDRLHPKWWWPMRHSDHPDAVLEGYKGHIAGMTGCAGRLGRVGKRDTVRLHAQYNVRTPEKGKGVMGIMVGYFAERR